MFAVSVKFVNPTGGGIPLPYYTGKSMKTIPNQTYIFILKHLDRQTTHTRSGASQPIRVFVFALMKQCHKFEEINFKLRRKTQISG